MNGSPPRPEQKSNFTKFNRALRDELKPIVIINFIIINKRGERKGARRRKTAKAYHKWNKITN